MNSQARLNAMIPPHRGKKNLQRQNSNLSPFFRKGSISDAIAMRQMRLVLQLNELNVTTVELQMIQGKGSKPCRTGTLNYPTNKSWFNKLIAPLRYVSSVIFTVGGGSKKERRGGQHSESFHFRQWVLRRRLIESLGGLGSCLLAK